ncbi:MAG: T9SS type A sorting domain-containing protein, partial [Candidatus Hydrothermia bacterium]
LLNIPGETGVNLSVYDPAGRRETELFSGRLAGGEHGFEMPDLGSGVHLVVAKTGFGTKTAKIITRGGF